MQPRIVITGHNSLAFAPAMLRVSFRFYAPIFFMYCQYSNRLFERLLASIVMLSMLALASCNRSQSNQSSQSDAPFDLDAVLNKYANADHYSDQARVVLNYNLNGAAFEEIHPCTVECSRNAGSRFHRFNLEVVSNSEITVARIHDPQSQNLGGQVLCLDQPVSSFWESVQVDSIARHFANGMDHIPWNPEVDSNRISQLLNTTYLLFNGTPPEWMSSNCLAETERVVVDDKSFDDVTFKTSLGPIACRFDAATKTLLGVRLSAQLLSPEVSTAPGVTNVTLALVFENGTFEKSASNIPRVSQYEHPVRRFVRLPEEFPSPSIGKKMECTHLVSHQNSSCSIQGTPSVFFFGLQNQYYRSELEMIEQLSNDYSFAQFGWIDPASESRLPEGYGFSNVRSFSDSKGELYQQVGISSMVFLLITDADGTIQFVSQREKGWLDKVGPVLQRIRKGDDVAREMHTEYSSYFAKYESELARVQVDSALLDRLKRN